MADLDPALVDQAARAIALAGDDGCFDCEFCGGDPDPEDYCSCGEDRDYCRKLARAALAVAPAIEANALRAAAESLRAADRNGYLFLHGSGERVPWQAVADWLDGQADQINPKEDPDG